MENQKIIVYKSNKLIEMQSDLSLIQLKIFTKVVIETIKNPNEKYIEPLANSSRTLQLS